MDFPGAPFSCSIDFGADGKRVGVLAPRRRGNAGRAGSRPIPLAVIRNGDGPTLLLTGGIHGDEYVGPAALFGLIQAIDPAGLNGRLIVLPAVNAPAVLASTRRSPIDGGDLNRLFARDGGRGATAAVASFIESFILPMCDAAIDIHSGGIADVYANVSMVYLGAKSADRGSVALAGAFGADFLWSDHFPERGTLNAAARRRDIPMMAVELGGGGGVAPAAVDAAHGGLRRAMASLGMRAAGRGRPPGPVSRNIAVSDSGSVRAPLEGLFVPSVAAGRPVPPTRVIGVLHSINEPARAPVPVSAPGDGVVVALINRGYVRVRDRLALIGQVVR